MRPSRSPRVPRTPLAQPLSSRYDTAPPVLVKSSQARAISGLIIFKVCFLLVNVADKDGYGQSRWVDNRTIRGTAAAVLRMGRTLVSPRACSPASLGHPVTELEREGCREVSASLRSSIKSSRASSLERPLSLNYSHIRRTDLYCCAFSMCRALSMIEWPLSVTGIPSLSSYDAQGPSFFPFLDPLREARLSIERVYQSFPGNRNAITITWKVHISSIREASLGSLSLSTDLGPTTNGFFGKTSRS